MSLLSPRLPDVSAAQSKDHIKWTQMHGASMAIAVANASTKYNGPLVVITPDTASAYQLQKEIESLLSDTPTDVHLFPDWQTLPYDAFSPHQDIVSTRLETISLLTKNRSRIFLIPLYTALQKLAPKTYIGQHLVTFAKGDTLDLTDFRRTLKDFGYLHVSQVMNHSEFSVRGSIIDLFPMGSKRPVRIDLFDDEIEEIHLFDQSSQRSLESIENLKLLPAHEFPTDKEGINQFKLNFIERFPNSNTGNQDDLLYQVNRGSLPGGIEYYLPLFFKQTATVFDYLHENAILIIQDDLQTQIESIWADIDARHQQYSGNLARPLLSPSELFIDKTQLFSAFKQFARISITKKPGTVAKGFCNFKCEPLSEIAIQPRSKTPYADLQRLLKTTPSCTVFIAESEGHKESLKDILNKAEIKVVETSLTSILDYQQMEQVRNQAFLTIGVLEDSFVCKDKESPLLVITEKQLFGQTVTKRRANRRQQSVDESAIIRNLAELSDGSPVVHIEHGVGRFSGLQTLSAGGVTTEFLCIEYAKQAKLYVPVASLHLISRYSGGQPEHAPLHHLGNETWSKAKKKAAEKVRDVAAQLLDIYAKRAAKPGFAYPLDWQEYTLFKNSFPYPETADQEKAINAVISDMGAPRSMDRLVCGDVGFGKTEVAMRAAFIAASCNKQVAILVPTTLLAQQHYDNFVNRFSGFALRIEVVSRFVSAKDQKAIFQRMENGSVDIVVGTHRLIQKDVKFNHLGLVIIDEEHRFGVRQKETFKALRADVDILSLTATPIPRTLNMAMSGMRDLSIIATPPAKRLAIKTFVLQKSDDIIREAIMREILRGGQVYFLHNEVKTIEKTAAAIEEIVPEARIAIGHGQMKERELESVMNDFYHQRYNVLVCSTIIETGIDIPTANTIIMDRADHLGLAQMHQLRGRVGRSHHQAYAYLLTPHPKRMTKDAVKRLEAISSLEGLGAGFALATHDLEIRGAGELLGDEQSGQINSIGFTLYMDMLEMAVKELKEGKEPSLTDTLHAQIDVDLRLPALIPDTYVPDVHIRLSLYKKLASCKNHEDINEFQIEMIDRFGLLPQPTKFLIRITELKLDAEKLGMTKLEFNELGGIVEFSEQTSIDPGFIIQLIQQQPKTYRFEGPQKLRITSALPDNTERLAFVENILSTFSKASYETKMVV
ncbi:MAG: transcription-repair coupling factor [Pseudomonadota bacterium]